jgi:hypothetical protein
VHGPPSGTTNAQTNGPPTGAMDAHRNSRVDYHFSTMGQHRNDIENHHDVHSTCYPVQEQVVHEDHRRAWENAHVVDIDNARVVDARQHPQQPRRTHQTPGSSSSPETTYNSQQFARDFSEVIPSPTRAERPIQDEPSPHRVNWEILAGTEDSFEEIDTREELFPPGRITKRTTEMYDCDGSRLL